MVTRFLTELTSSSDFIFDLTRDEQRVAFAVLLDKVENLANDANLEILAIHADTRPEDVFDTVITLAKKHLPTNRSGFAIGFPASFSPARSIAERHSLLKNYEMYEMLNKDPAQSAKSNDGDFSLSTDEDEQELFSTLKISFRENPDTSIPSFEDWRNARMRNKDGRTWVKRSDGKIIAFLNLLLAEHSAEISTVGVLPERRGAGYARGLISHAMAHLVSVGIKECKLSVAVQNQRALNLYKNLGFQPTDHHLVFRWARKNP